MGKRYYLVVRASFLHRLEVKREEMNFKQTLIIIAVIVILMIGLYYLMSPLQNCLRFPLECPYLPELFLEP